MPKSKDQKKEILENIKDKLAKSKAVVFSADKGLDVKTVESLRQELKENQAEYLVTKKTLLQLTNKDRGDIPAIDDLQGSVALTFSYHDEVSAAKILSKYAKTNDKLELGGGILENSFIMPEMVKRLAALPSREVLLATLLASMKSPVTGLANVLSGNIRNLVGVLSAIKDKKQ